MNLVRLTITVGFLLISTQVIADDYDNDCSSAFNTELGTIMDGQIEIVGDIDCFRIEIPLSGELIIFSTGGMDSYGILYDAGCNSVIESDNIDEENNNFSIHHPVNAGTYYIAVRHASPEGTGSYSLNISYESDKLISSGWSQSGSYEVLFDMDAESPCNADPVFIGDSLVVGCTAVAVGQLFNYYLPENRVGWLETMLENITVYPRFKDGLFTEIISCEHPGYTTQDSYVNSISEPLDTDEIALKYFLWNIAIGLDAKFAQTGTAVGNYSGEELYDWVDDPNDKLISLLHDRFRISADVVHTNEFTRIDSDQDYIINSINRGDPVLMNMWGNRVSDNHRAGHTVIIDAYKLYAYGAVDFKINFGWGDTLNLNTSWYNGQDAFNDAVNKYSWNTFVIFHNTTPVIEPHGTLSIYTTPVDGEILLNGESVGVGEWSGSVLLGTYTISYGDVAGYTTPAPQIIETLQGQVTYAYGAYILESNVAADFTANPLSGVAPLIVQFTDQSISENTTITSWAWDFGDGGMATAQFPSHTYNNPGVYSVSLTVSDGNQADTQAITNMIDISATGQTGLFFSEYIQGSSFNKAIEIYNGTGSSVGLSDYAVVISYSGSSNPREVVLSGTLLNGEVYVIAYPAASTTILTEADMTDTDINFSGNDYLSLVFDSNGDDVFDSASETIDVIGVLGEDPGVGWDVAGVIEATEGHTLIRKANVVIGNTNWATSAGFNTDNSEWIVLPENSFGFIGSHPHEPGTINVPSDHSTIQGAINAAFSNDSILVQPGTYQEELIINKKITLVSSDGPTNTIISGSQTYPAFRPVYFGANADSAIIDGFTVNGGSGESHWQLDGESLGGGIKVEYSSPILKNLIVQGNEADYGSGIWLYYSNAKIYNVILTDNISNDHYLGFTIPGRAILLFESSPEIMNVTIFNHSTSIYCADNSHPVIINSIINNNDSDQNSTNWQNEIILNADSYLDSYLSGSGLPSSVSLNSSNIKNGIDGITIQDNESTIIWGAGNQDQDNPVELSIPWDLHLTNRSPCIGAGISSFEIDGEWYYAPTYDLEGNPRPNPAGSNPDMGAYEHTLAQPEQPLVLNVPDDYSTIQAAIDATQYGDTVVVGPGIYEECLFVENKNIIVMSAGGAANTYINGGWENSITDPRNSNITIASCVTTSNSNIVLDGFTLQGGRGLQNSMYSFGGGLAVNTGGDTFSNNCTFRNLVIRNNSATFGGGGHLAGSGYVFENILFYDNVSGDCDEWGCNVPPNAGLMLEGDFGAFPITFTNVTSYDNPQALQSLYGSESSVVNIINTIFNNGVANFGSSTVLNVYHSLVGVGVESIDSDGTVNWDESNTIGDPQFIDLDNADYRLANNSPCLGAGVSVLQIDDIWYSAPITDLEGNIRPNPVGTNPDMGAFESPNSSPINLAPIAQDDTFTILEDESIIINVLENDADPESQTIFLVTLDLTGTQGLAFIDYANHNIVYTPSENYFGEDSFDYNISDGNLLDTASVTIVIEPINDPQEPFSLVYPTIEDEFVTTLLEDTTITFTWNRSIDVDSDVSYWMQIYLDFFGNIYSIDYPNITDTTHQVNASSLDALLSGLNMMDAQMFWYVISNDGEFEWTTALGTFHLVRNSSPTWVGIQDTSFLEDGSLTIYLDEWVVDLNDPAASLEFAVSEGTNIHTSLNSESHILEFSADPDSSGFSEIFMLTVSDVYGQADLDTLIVSILPVNDPPIVVNPLPLLELEEDFLEELIGLTDVFLDDQPNILNLSVLVENQYLVTAIIEEEQLHLNSVNNQFGTTYILITATDDSLAYCSDTLHVEIAPVNDAPLGFSLLWPPADTTFAGVNDTLLLFSWEPASDVDSDNINYSVLFTSTGFDSAIYDITESYLSMNVEQFERDTPVEWNVFAHDGIDSTQSNETATLTIDQVVGVDNYATIPEDFILEQNYPNPFNPVTTIRYGLPQETGVALVIYDVMGHEIQTWSQSSQKAGWYELTWHGTRTNGSPAPTGIYFARLVAGGYSRTIKMLYLK